MPFKNLSLFISILSFLSISAKAQDYNSSTYDNKRVSMGIAISPNLSWLRYGDFDVKSSSAKVGYNYGLIADFAFSENYYFSSGLFIDNLRSQSQTYHSQADGSTNTLTNNYRLQYAEIPFGIKLKSTQRYYRSYYGQFGFTMGVKLSAKQEILNENRVVVQESNNMKGDANLLRLGLQIGGGVEWLLDHNLRLMTGLSFNNGFTRVIKHGSANNSYVAFNFGILF
ncbi:outer membrane beta-barrel protein [Olivibacter domesticus]|uniref:Outer membrane protein beta-barrel domain-containing protein n=1 Tax=Olivibacter domesticus TaxID=407022 RepID=A0A1H7XAG3_OLID1|nr:outer membrane beta-barrel protein [Olivibacter domesticus]SEM30796.1 Outer membrane protein beta-barrel domain-containing protein [Olivibacter domesticus]